MFTELVPQRHWRILHRRAEQPILLGSDHLLQLATACHQCTECSCGGIWQGAYLRLDGFGKMRQHRGIQSVRLGQLTRGTRKIAHLARVDDHHRQAGQAKLSRDQHLVAAGRFQHNAFGLTLAQLLDQPCYTGRVVADLPARPSRAHRHIQAGFTDINSDPLCRVGHSPLRTPEVSMAAQPCRYGLTAWWPWQLFGLCSS